MDETLPGMDVKKPENTEPGPVQIGIQAQIEKLTEDGWISMHHAGQVALAVRAAQDVDQSAGKGAPSGRANLLRAMKEILEMLPQPELIQGDSLDRALEAMLNGTEV